MRGGARPGARGKLAEEILVPAFAAVKQCSVRKTTPPVRIVRFLQKTVRGKLRTFEGFFERNGMADFEGGYRGLHVCLDAKRWDPSSSRRWTFSAVLADHQIDRISEAHDAGSLAGIILAIDYPIAGGGVLRWYGLSWSAIGQAIADGRKSLCLSEVDELADAREGVWRIHSDALGLRPKISVFLDMLLDERVRGIE